MATASLPTEVMVSGHASPSGSDGSAQVWSWLNSGLAEWSHLLGRDVERDSAEVHLLV
jgi:hypothetical protein